MSTPDAHGATGHGAPHGRATDHRRTAEGWTIVVPVKDLGRAKSRLARVLPAPVRRALVLAMAGDVLRACVAAPAVSRVRVVSSDPEVSTLARGMGLEVVSEPPAAAEEDVDPLNTAVAAALAGVSGPVGVIAADLPELRADHLAQVLVVAAEHRHSTVPDHRGAGTTMAFWTGPATGRIPRFGTGSAVRFRTEGGAVPLSGADPTGAVGRDVDTPGDVAALATRPVGPATATALREHSATLTAPPAGVSATMVP